MIEIFELEYQEDITLDTITYVRDWSDSGIVEPLDSIQLYGLFISMIEKDVNKIRILNSRKFVPLYRDSVIVHELAHFFTKKAIFKEGEGGYWGMGMMEVIGYYMQDLYLKEHGDKGVLWYYSADDKKSNIDDDTFAYSADLLYMTNRDSFLNYAVVFFNKDAPEKFKNFTKGNYSIAIHPIEEDGYEPYMLYGGDL